MISHSHSHSAFDAIRPAPTPEDVSAAMRDAYPEPYNPDALRVAASPDSLTAAEARAAEDDWRRDCLAR